MRRDARFGGAVASISLRHRAVPYRPVRRDPDRGSTARVGYSDSKSSVKLIADSTRMLFGLVAICAREYAGRYCLPNPAMAPEVVRRWSAEMSPAAVSGALALSLD